MRIQKIAGKESKLDLDAQHTQIDFFIISNLGAAT